MKTLREEWFPADLVIVLIFLPSKYSAVVVVWVWLAALQPSNFYCMDIFFLCLWHMILRLTIYLTGKMHKLCNNHCGCEGQHFCEDYVAQANTWIIWFCFQQLVNICIVLNVHTVSDGSNTMVMPKIAISLWTNVFCLYLLLLIL